MLLSQKQVLSDLLGRAVQSLIASDASIDAPAVATPGIVLERPKVAAHGDVACNVAMQLAKPLGKNPRTLAAQIVAALLTQADAKALIASAEVAGPGFINIRLTNAAKQAVITTVLAQGESFGRSQIGKGQPVLIEFVSANPTGPLHVGHGRQGALGDALSNLLDWQGWQVHREFYYNDAGVQINNLALSVTARAKGLAPSDAAWPESAYNGEYIADIARAFLHKETVAASDGVPVTGTGDADDLSCIRAFAVAYLRREQDLDLLAFGVKFEQYYLESSLYTEGKVERAVQALTTAGKTYEQEGALWLRTTDEGDDKDRVMRKTDGTYTYFVPDVAYHVTKWQRGYHKVINVQGSDHHGTIARVRAGLQGVGAALGLPIPKDYPSYVLHKMVTVMKNGAEVKISKRAGAYVTVRDLIEWSGNVTPELAGEARENALTRGRDAVRFFLISRKADTEFVFDVDLALKQNDENPVYYVQYAHARICTILLQWQQEGGLEKSLTAADLTLLSAPQEMTLMQRLAEFPEMLTHAAQDLAPHAVAFYLRDLAGDFHSFYNAQRVLIDDSALKQARLALLAATRQVLRNGLAVIGVSAPVRM